jgi:YesN/AraC family two-component response regulator
VCSEEIPYILAEDEPPIRRNLIRKIERLAPDFKLLGEASGGEQALELVKELRPRVLFTDIRMPGMNGLELLEELHRLYPELLLVVISGYNEFDYAQHSIRQGVCDYLLKPVDPDLLNSTLGKLRHILAERDGALESGIEKIENRAGKDLALQTAELIRSRIRENIAIQEIADELKVNSTYLSRTFKEQYGVTPSRFIQQEKTDQARRLLIRYPEMEVKESSAFLGYSDQNYFSRVFKKETGLSPMDYRSASGDSPIPSETD